ncbi:MAG: ABC transporter substrate-binding protein [Actinobacteria bacterium]|nr:ABC transporter substrate-binding protein [Actinomycetota bacterium]
MDINSLDPARVYCDTCMIFSTAVYETLVTRDPADITKQIPRLAESWEANADNTVFTFQLNPAAKFADGSPVEAKDVKWSWERLNHVKGSASYMMDGYTNIDTPDASTVVVTFGAPNSAFLAIVSASQMGITNSDEAIAAGSIADETAETADQSEQFYFTRSLGSGPFELESYTEGDALVLKRNDNYWGTKSPFPKVTFKQVKDSASQLQQLQAGDVDIAMQISLDSLSQIESDPNLTVTTTDSYNFAYIALSAGAESAPPELADPKVREAIKLAIDYDGMLDVTVGGKGKKQASTIPNGFEGSADLPLPAQDVDKAKQLLTEAGVTSLTLKAMYPNINVYGVDFSVMMQKVQQDLKEIGVDVQLEPAEFSAWLDTIRGVGIPLTAVYFAPDHPDTSQYPQYFGMIEGAPWSGRAGGGAAGTPIINEKEAPLLAAALAASGEERVQLYTELGQEMINDLVHFPMVNPQLVIASQKDITGNHYSGCCNLDLSFLGITG